MSTPTIVVFHGTGGRLGNRLMLQAHLMACCLAHPPRRLVNFNFVPFAPLFDASRLDPWMVFPPIRRRSPTLVGMMTSGAIAAANLHAHLPDRWASRISRHGTRVGHRVLGPRAELLEWGDGRRQDLDDPTFLAWADRFDWIVLGGFLYRGWRALETHQAAVREFLAPAREYAAPAETLVATLRARHRTLVGLLVRRTDYAHWLDGRFYFRPEQYREWMRQLLDLFGPDAGLVVASDDPETARLVEGLPAYLTTGAAGRPGHYMESVAALSMCDIVASPPSTFAAMAAFLGGAPIMPLHTAGQRLLAGDLMPRHLFDAVEHPQFGLAVS